MAAFERGEAPQFLLCFVIAEIVSTQAMLVNSKIQSNLKGAQGQVLGKPTVLHMRILLPITGWDRVLGGG